MATDITPTNEQIETLRDLFLKKLEKDVPPCDGSFHPKDMERVKTTDRWLQLFLENVDLDMKQALKMLWDTCIWRKTYGANEISVENIRMDYMDGGAMFVHNKDINGKYLLILKTKLHQKGTKDVNELIRLLVYWIERCHRETNYDQVTLFFDMATAGLGNMDMDFTKRIIDTFKLYYPNSLNYIVIFDMPWILSAAFKIIKGLLPPKAVAKMKFLNGKTIKEIVDEENCLKSWGGNDPYEFKFQPEQENNNSVAAAPPTAALPEDETQISVGGSAKKVHFANPSPPDSPMSEVSTLTNYATGGEGEMLHINPVDAIVFSKIDREYAGTVDILNVCQDNATYKIKTTSPDKFRVKPSSGVLTPGATVTINVVLQPGQQLAQMNKDKFLVMCMAVPPQIKANPQAIAELWKKTPSTSSQIEQHRLKCTLPHPAPGDGFKNGRLNVYDTATTHYFANDNQKPNLNISLNALTEQNQRLESQVKFTQKLQWMTLILFLLLSAAIVYILKMDINEGYGCAVRNNQREEL